MKTIYTYFLSFLCLAAVSSTAFAANILVKTMPLGDGITTTGLVRVVVKVTDQHVGRDLGIILHENEADALVWDAGIGIMMFQNLYAAVPNTSQVEGWDGNATAFTTTSGTKNIAKGTKIALWFDIDIANQTQRLVAQTSDETTPAEVFSGYKSRAAQKATKPATNAKFCTVFYNNTAATTANGGQTNTAAAIEVLSDAQIVSSVEAFDFSQLTTEINKNIVEEVSVFPTITSDFINISSAEKISNVRIYSMLAKTVYETEATNQINISELQSGSYIIEIKTANNNLVRKSFLKK